MLCGTIAEQILGLDLVVCHIYVLFLGKGVNYLELKDLFAHEAYQV